MRIQPITLAWTFAAGFLGAAIVGFIPNPLVGSNALFVTNTAHNLVHLLTAVGFTTVAMIGDRASTRFMLAFGAVYALVAAYGFIALGGASEGYLLGVIHINALDNFLHAGFGAVISAAGYLSYKAGEWSAAPAVVTSAVLLLVGTVVVTGLGASAEVTVEATQPMTQRYVTFTDEHHLVRPDGYRRWVYVGAPLTPNDHRTIKIDGLNIFYREAGDPSNPTILLLHGFPTSSHMFRNLLPALADQYHLVAPDYPGYGNSSMPAVEEFDYTFDRLSQIVEKLVGKLEIQRYSLYLMDYGAPVGFRLATAHPERVQALIIQNGNAYDEGIDNNFWEPIKAYWKDRGAINQGLDNDFWKNVKAAYKQPNMSNDQALRFLVTLGATQWQYTNGVRNKEVISPDNWHVTQRLLDRAGNEAIQLQLFYDYGSNPPLYPAWQEYLRMCQPPTLIVWGQNDEIFPADGAHPYKRDLETLEFHLLDTGHFALEEDEGVIADLMREFLRKHVA